MSLHIALCDRDADDTYPAEHWAARKLDAWRALKRGFWDGGNVGGQADLTDGAWTAMELRRDDTPSRRAAHNPSPATRILISSRP